MSRRGPIVLASAVAFVVACSIGAGAGAGAGRALGVVDKPRLLVAELDPLTVRGMSFRPRERVTVTLDGGKRGTKRVQANRLGRFTARFEVQVPRCRTVTVRAVGSQGSRVVYQLPRPNCREP